MRRYYKTLADKKVVTKVHEIIVPPPEVHVNLCDGEEELNAVVKREIITHSDLMLYLVFSLHAIKI